MDRVWKKWEALEEGKLPEMTQKARVYLMKEWKRSMFMKSYTVYLLLFIVIVNIRPSIPLEKVSLFQTEKSAIDHTGVYVHMKSRTVDHIDQHIREVAERLKEVATDKKYVCLASIHLGIPMRIVYMGVPMINPTIQSQGTKTTQAYETSAFFPSRKAILVTRFTPVTISYLDLKGNKQSYIPKEPQDMHCMLHMISQLDGLNIYD